VDEPAEEADGTVAAGAEPAEVAAPAVTGKAEKGAAAAAAVVAGAGGKGGGRVRRRRRPSGTPADGDG
jgi:hypothetical protein